MKLKYPLQKDMMYWKARQYPNIMLTDTHTSPYYLIGLAESGFDIYVAFTNYNQDQVWIEKTHKLMGLAGMYAKSFCKIDSDEEFNSVHRFFIEQGILDGTKDSRKDS